MNTFHFIGLVGGAGAPESWMTESFFGREARCRADLVAAVYDCRAVARTNSCRGGPRRSWAVYERRDFRYTPDSANSTEGVVFKFDELFHFLAAQINASWCLGKSRST